MSENLNSTENISIETLKEENLRLKKQVEELTLIKNLHGDNDVFEKAKTISNFAYWSFSIKHQIFTFSQEAKKFLEIPTTINSLSLDDFFKFFYQDDKDAFMKQWSEKISTENYFSIKTRIRINDGSIRYIAINTLVDRDAKFKPINLTGIIIDETETHYKIEAITKNEKLYRSLYNNLTDVFIVFETIKDNEGNIIDYIYKDVNPTFESKFKLQKNDIVNKKLSLQSSIFQQFHSLLMLTAITNEPQQDRLFIQMLDSFFDVLIYSTTDNTLATIWRDVSLMVEADSSLRESEEKYRQIFSIGSDSLFMVEFTTGKILDVNPTACKMFGYTKDALMRMKLKHLFVTDESFEKQIAEQKVIILNEVCRKQDESDFPVEVSLSYFNWSGRKVAVASIRDISERIIAQEELIKSEQKFKQLFDDSNDAIFIIKNYRIIDLNKKAISLFKLESDQLLNKTFWNLSPSKQSGGEDSRTKAVEYIQNSLLGNQLQYEWVFQKSDQKKFFADIKLSPISYGNEKVVQAIIRDISNQKESQDALRSKEQRWKQSLQIGSIGVWDWNIQTNETYFSTGWKNILGFETNEIPNKFEEYEKRIHPNDVATVYNTIDEYLTSKTNNYSIDFRMRCKNGTYKWIHAQGKIISYNADGKPERFIGTHIDITKQRVYEEKILTQKNELSIAAEISKLGYWELDLKNMILTGSANSFLMFGYEGIEQLSMRQIEIFIHPEDRKSFISQFISNDKTIHAEIIFRAIINNQTKYIFSKSRPIKNNENVLIGYKGIFQDITSLKQEEIKLKEDQNLMRTFALNLQQSIEVVQNDNILFQNEKLSELTGFTPAEITTNKITPFQIAVPEDRIAIRKVCDSTSENPPAAQTIDVRIETKNNRLKWVELSISSFIFNNIPTFIFILNDITHKKNTEFELITNENRFRTIAASSSFGIALSTEDGDIFYLNNSLQNFLEINQKIQFDKNLYSYFNEDDSVEIKENIQLFKSKKITLYKKEIKLKNAPQIWISITIKPTFKISNEIDYLILTIENIEEEKVFRDNLELTNQLQNIVISNLTEGHAIFDSNFKLINCNTRFLELTKLELEKSIGLKISKIGILSKVNTDILANVLRENNNTLFEVYPSENQTFNASFTLTEINNEISYLLFLTDITESKKEVEAIVSQREKFRNIVEESPKGIALIDKNRQIVYANNKYAQTFGHTTSNIIFKKIDEFTRTENLSELISMFSQLYTGIRQSFSQSLQMTDKNSKFLWISSTITTMKDKYGDITFAIQIIDDITLAKENENTIVKNERLQTIKDIANYYAHNLNIITNKLYGSTYLAKNKLSEKGSQSLVNNFTDIANKANVLANNLLVFSDSKRQINSQIDINELIDDIINNCNLPSNIKVHKSFDIKLNHFACDILQLRNAIQNIIDNAVEAMPLGGKLSIETNDAYFDEPKIHQDSGIRKGKYLRIIVSDTGIGIKKTDLQHVFDPYFSTKQNEGHPGIGLSVSKKIIEQYNGAIKIFSTVNEGTNTNIYLPECEAFNTEQLIAPDEKIIQRGASNVLLVDDELVIRTITAKILADIGHDVYSFSNHMNAIQFFKINHNSIDLIIIDKQMPNIDGEELCNILFNINPKIKAVLLTNGDSENQFESFLRRKNNRIIQKPISAENLFEVISGLSNL
jgi:PAS domain S-box-containing protein